MTTIEDSKGQKLTVANKGTGGFPCIAIHGSKGGEKAYIEFTDEDAMKIVKELMKA